MATTREARALTRVSVRRGKKIDRRTAFLVKFAARKNMPMEMRPCQNGNIQIVSEVATGANMFFFKSCACSGCPEGAQFINSTKAGNIPKKQLGCHLLAENWLMSSAPVKVGERVMAGTPTGVVARSFKNPVPEEDLAGEF